MELKQLLQDLSAAHLSGPESVSVTGICYDSRKAAPGCLFVAIRGFRSDGHAFITAALERGAAAVLLETPPKDALPGNIPVYQMKNTRRGLAQAAAAFYGHPERELRLIGVTGTNGKTTSTFLIRHILEKTGHKCGLIGTTGVWVGEDFREAERTTPE
ncbi:MAG: Mur ligase domain-containing protein, partial [Clostridia bacterium]|nr:Mur ligase domain-containing protein [Clostridia bacterium]